MKLSTNDLKNERQWRSSAGYDKSGFCELVPLFKRRYLKLFRKSLPERQADEPELFDNNYAPVRSFANLTEFGEYFRHHDTLIIDATEQPVQRPGDQDEQKLNYSGKKRHTVKNRLIIGQGKTIQYLSPYWCGKTHDYRILKEEFPPSTNWFESFNIRLDLGYPGFDKDYACSTVYLPFKNRKTASLTDEQKTINRGFASERIGIEHSTGGLKRYRALSDRLRTHDLRGHDSTLEVCAGL